MKIKSKLSKKIDFFSFFLFFFLTNLVSYGQGTISGTITDVEQEVVIGATIYIAGTSMGTTSDVDGLFRFSAPAGEQNVVVSFVGYRTVEQTVTVRDGETTTLNVTLSEDGG